MLDRRLYTCCFTGHRELTAAQAESLPALLTARLTALLREDFHVFLSGGALGFDLLAAEAVLGLKERYPFVRLGLILPCADQTNGWDAASIRRYDALCDAADSLEILQQRYTPGCMRRRNAALVEQSSHCLAFCLRETSGTGQTMGLARRAGLSVENLADALE